MSSAQTDIHTSADDSDVPIEVYAAESPSYADIPFWLTACVRLAPPVGRTGKPFPAVDKVFPVVQAALADRMRVDQENVGLDRELISLIAGYMTAKEGRWIVQYLQRIGFLRARKNYEPGSGRRHPDTFVANTRPPLGYVGPMTYAELARALRSNDPAARVLFVDSEENRRSEPRDAQASVGSEVYGRPGVSRGQNRRSEPRDAQASVADREDGGMEGTPTEFPPSRSIDQTRDAAGAAASASVETFGEARALVRRLPWRQKGHNLTAANAEKLALVIAAAIAEHGFTVEDAQAHALRKLAESTSVAGAASYVIKGFAPDQLYEPLADDSDVLPLPEPEFKDHQAASEAAKQGKPSLQPVPAPLRLPACGTCGAQEGEGLIVRTVESGEGRAGKCPDCHPHAMAA